MTDDDSILAKTTCDEIRWLENLWKRWIQVKKGDDQKFFGTSMDMIFARSLGLTSSGHLGWVSECFEMGITVLQIKFKF